MKGTKTLQRLCYKSLSCLKHNSSAILTCIGAVGVVATTVSAVRVTPKAVKLLEKATDEKGEELTKLEIISVAGPVYIPSLAIGISTIACIFSANVMNKRQQAALVSAYSMLDQSYKRYRKAANSVYGDDADSKIKAEIAKDMYISADGYYIHDPDMNSTSENCLFYDSYSQRYFESTMPAVLNAQYHLNRNFALRGYVTLNEYYEFLGIEKIDGGDELGWGFNLIEDGIMWIDFGNHHITMDDGLECCIIDMMFDPTLNYMNDY